MIALSLVGCASADSTALPTITKTRPPSPTVVSVTSTPSPAPTITATLTPPVALEPEQAKETIRTLLREPVDCTAPCFWGIVPGQTTLGEAKNIFAKLRFSLEYTNTLDGKEFYDSAYDFDNGLSVSPLLAVQNNIVTTLTVYITPETQQEEVPREWSTYSPETLITRYGTPSRVDFFLGRVAPTPDYSIVLYFDTVDLIVEYYGYDYTFDGSFVQTCPLINQWNDVRIWMGKNPQYPPSLGVSLEEATSLTLEEFSILMTGDPQNACLKLKENVFP